jgi:hypothetical protein
MLQNNEIVRKFKEGSSISNLTNFIIGQVRLENSNIKKAKDRTRITTVQAKHIVENAIYQEMISHK